MSDLPQDMLKLLLDNAPSIIIVVGKDRKIRYVSGGGGEQADQAIGKDPLEFVGGVYRDRVRDTIEAVFETGEPGQYEVMSVDQDGGTAWYTTAVGPIVRDGELVAVSLFSTDITDRKMAEQELARAKDELLAKQAEAIMELSTPVIQIWDKIVVLPLIGAVDTTRAQQILENMLESISATHAEVAIIDITGVPVVDTKVAHHFLQTIEAAKLLGTKTVLTGVSSYNAQTLVQLGVDLSSISTKGSLMSGLKLAFQITGKQVMDGESP
jgi:PAS domain S-box-containing protein